METMEVFDCEQGTEEWFQCRMKIPTASAFHTVLAKGAPESLTRKKYMLTLIGEALTEEPCKTFSNAHTDRGHILEPEALAAYEYIKEEKCTRVGFIRNGRKGASPDALVNIDGLAEIKSRIPVIQLETILRDSVPRGVIPQIQGQIWLSEREWCDYVSYCPKLPIFIRRVYRDDSYINKTLWPAINKFNNELDEIMEKFK